MSSGIRGRRVVVGLYLVIVVFSGVIGYLAAGVVDEITPPQFLFLVAFPATRLGLAAYGALTIGLVLGVLLWLVTVVSERIDDVEPGRNDDPIGGADSTANDSGGDSTSTDSNDADHIGSDEDNTDEDS